MSNLENLPSYVKFTGYVLQLQAVVLNLILFVAV